MSEDPEHPKVDTSKPPSGEALFAWPRQSGHLAKVMAAIQEREQRQKVQRLRQTWRACAVAAFLLATGLLLYRVEDSSANEFRPPEKSARVTQPERKTLPDGTRVELKGSTEIEVQYSANERRVVLRRGEAHFEVVKNAERVFVVDAGGVEFRAVGTAFAVQLEAQRVEMIVTEGRVAVNSASDRLADERERSGPEIVDAGSHAEVRLDGQALGRPVVQTLLPQQVNERLAWRVPRLELNETPLSEVIAAFNRLGRVRIEIGDRSLEGLAISGVLRADNAGALVRVLESNYGIRVEQTESDAIVLRAGQRD